MHLERRADDQEQTRLRGQPLCARSIACAGSSSPNITTPGFRISPHSGHGGSGSERDGVLHRHADAAVDALGLAHRAVHLDDLARAGALRETVDVLGHDGPHRGRVF